MNDILQPRNPIVWVDTPESADEACREILAGEEKVIGLDLETTLEDPPRLCTVQVATRAKNYVFDVLAIEDLAPIFRILEDPAFIKVIHYARFEKGVLGNLGVEISNIFDTFVASEKLRGKMDRYAHSLAAVCRRELGAEIDKSNQKSDWSIRPLTQSQLRYAALDAELMILLYDVFQAELNQPELPISQ